MKAEDKWYFTTTAMIMLFLCLGPLALPICWINPRLTRKNKIIITVIVVAVSGVLGVVVVGSVQSIVRYYGQVFEPVY